MARARRLERENPPGKHPEWLISADESLFSFRLNTLNRAPSDVYLHSLRANAGGGPGRLQGHSRAGGGEKLWAASASTMVVGEGEWYFPDPALGCCQLGGGRGEYIPVFRHWVDWTVGHHHGDCLAVGMSPTDMQALKVAAFCRGGTTLSSTSQPHNKEHVSRQYRPHPGPAASPL